MLLLQIHIDCLPYHLAHAAPVFELALGFGDLLQPKILVFKDIKRLSLPYSALDFWGTGYRYPVRVGVPLGVRVPVPLDLPLLG